MRPLLLVLVVTSVLPAEDSVMSGPSMGYVFDGGLRPVLGSPGAAVLGDRIDLGRPLASAVSAPSGTYALAITSDDSSLLLVTFGSPVQQSVLGSATGGRIAFSPDAKSAALFSPGQSGISVWTGLPDNPSSRTADAGGPIAGLALDDTGAVVLAAVQDGDAFRVVRIDTGGGFQRGGGWCDAEYRFPAGEHRRSGGCRQLRGPLSLGRRERPPGG